MKPDWIIHYILDAWPSSHTHGLSRYGGLELELNLPVSQEKAMMILKAIPHRKKCQIPPSVI